jgi:hypothetical protein
MRLLLTACLAVSVLTPGALPAQDSLNKVERGIAKKVHDKILASVFDDENELSILSQLLGRFDNVASRVQPDWKREDYKTFIRSEAKQLLNDLQLTGSRRDTWATLIDDVLNLKQIADEVEKTEKAADSNSSVFRALLGRVVRRAAQLEVFRTDGLTEDEAFFALDVQELISSTQVPESLTENAKLVPGPGVGQRPVPVMKALLKAFEETENSVSNTISLDDYKKLVIGKTNDVFTDTKLVSNKNWTTGWQNGRKYLLLLLDEESGGDVIKFRNLVRAPVRRGIELELARVEGVLAVQGLLATSGGGSGGARGRTTSRRRGKGGFCCLKLLFPPLDD